MASDNPDLKATPTEKILSLDDIMAAADVEYGTAPGFAPGQVFRIQSLTAGDMIDWSEANEGEAKRTAGLRLIVKSLVDEKGARILADEHIAVLRRKSHRVTEGIVKAILKLNGMNVEQEKSAGKG